MKTQSETNSLVDRLKKSLQPVFKKYEKQIVFSYIFGSMVTGGYDLAKSDIDLAFYLDSDALDLDFQLSLMADCGRALKSDRLDLVILNQIKNLILAEEIVRTGQVIFERDKEKRDLFELKIIHQAIDFQEHRKMVIGF